MQRYFDEELAVLKKNILEMGSMVERSILNSVEALKALSEEALLLIARHLERICDHATNIAEDVIFLVMAKVVKHHPEKLK